MARQIHSDTDATKPVIIALTASAYTEDRCKALAAGVDDYLPKPVQTDQLLRVLSDHLELSYIHTAETHGADLPPASDVPAGLITAIQSALQDGDTDQLLTLADTLAGENALAAQQLRRMVEEYDYDAVEQWLLRA